MSTTLVLVILVVWSTDLSEAHSDLCLPQDQESYCTKQLTRINGTYVDWGLTLPNGTTGEPCIQGDQCLDFGVARVVVTADDHCQRVEWTASDELLELMDCVYMTGHWYGGGTQFKQPWPIEKNPRQETAYVTADLLRRPLLWYGGVTESYWISSAGLAVKVDETIPLFVSLRDTTSNGTADRLCLSAKYSSPFEASTGVPLRLNYHLCFGNDVRQVHELTFPKFYSLPSGVPDSRMIQDPIWSTWAEYYSSVDENKVRDMANNITFYGFTNSQIEIDDRWESCYGDATFDTTKFPDPKGLTDDLHAQGFRVTLWVHPFINDDCQSFTEADQNGFFVKDTNGTTQLTSWWAGLRAGIIDFTNTAAVAWWSQRLEALRTVAGIDSFKFDAGESTYLPDVYTLNASEVYWPNIYSPSYVEAVSAFGTQIEVRVGRTSQRHPVFVRMLDKSSVWGDQNGLQTLVTSLLHSGIVGYPFCLPDMVGGNGYEGRPDSELFARWAQANVFMPTIQFSILPWDYGTQVVDLCLQVTALHAAFAPLILDLALQATMSPSPIARPTWWLCPLQEECLVADQQFLLGDDILAVPIVTQGATSVRPFLPPGNWTLSAGGTYQGLTYVDVSNIDINSIVYFTRTF